MRGVPGGLGQPLEHAGHIEQPVPIDLRPRGFDESAVGLKHRLGRFGEFFLRAELLQDLRSTVKHGLPFVGR